MSFKPSAYQQAIFDYLATSTDPLVVQALAGSGKTTSLLECAKRLPPYENAIFVAFNKHIADHLGNKLLGTPMQAQTLHSVGYRVLAKELDGKLEVDSRKYYKLAKEKLEKERYFEFFDRTRNRLNDEGYELVLALSDLVGFVQKTNSFNVRQIIQHFGLPTVLYTFMHTERTVRELIAEGERIARNERRIDYNEMIWLPLRWNLSLPTYDTVFCDESQDFSATQLELVLKSSNGGRKVFVGDKNQAIYGFAGAANDSVDRIVKRTNANELPLSICYRCDRNIISLAQEVVPHIEAREGAGEGLVKNIVPGAVVHKAKEGDLILSRKTAPLISTCLDFIGNGVPAKVKGRDIGKQLTSIVKKVMKIKGYDWEHFLFYLTEYEHDEIDILTKRDATPAHIESVQDRVAAVRVCYATMKPVHEEDLCRKIENLFDDTKQLIELSTVHRAKGLEADRVFIIDAASLPLPLGGWQEKQEWNLRYVAITRAKHELYIEGNFTPGPYAEKEIEDVVAV